MSSEKIITFGDLVNSSFRDGSLHIRHLQILFKFLVHKLKFENLPVSLEDELKEIKRAESAPVNIDFVSPTIPNPKKIQEVLCKSETTNPIVDMLDLLNIEKRVEAIEIIVHKLTSMIDSLMKRQPIKDSVKTENNFDEEKIETIETYTEDKRKALTTSNTFEGDKIIIKSPSTLTPSNPLTKSVTSTKSIHEKSETIKENFSQPSGPSFDELNEMIRKQLQTANDSLNEKVSKLSKNICELQTTVMSQQDTTEDLWFACETIDGKNEETSREIKDFNSKFFCLKSDVKELINDSKQFKEEFDVINRQMGVLNNVKTNKSYVDELWSQKAFKTDLEFFVPKSTFEPSFDRLQLHFKLITEHLSKLEANTKKSLGCLQSIIDEKLEKKELKKFKDSTTKLFDDFIREIVVLLHKLTKNPLGLAATKRLDPNLNCILCETKLSMKKNTTEIPKLSAISRKFKHEMQKIQVNQVDNENFRQVFCLNTLVLKPKP